MSPDDKVVPLETTRRRDADVVPIERARQPKVVPLNGHRDADGLIEVPRY